jgi:acetyltransferase
MSIRNLDGIFHPKSIVLVGGSRKPGSVGDVLARNLLSGGFDGPVMFVHPSAPALQSTLAYRSIAELPTAPDLAVIATPPDTVPGLVAQAAARGARGAIVISAGFGELGADGLALETQMLEAARPACLRIVGPNCVGVLSPLSGLNASFAHVMPRPGGLALLTQSGAMLTGVLDWAHARGIGFSHLVSLGGMADADTGDMLDYLAAEPRTHAILAYIESVKHARKFMSAARRAARVKPVIVIKAGRHAEGARAAASHTGAMAGADAVFDAAIRRAGVLRVREIAELFDAAATLAHTRAIPGGRVAILTNGGGLGVLSADRAADEGLEVADLAPATLAALNAALPRTWSHGNPVDIIGDAPAARYSAATDALLADPGVDAIVALNCPVATASSEAAAQAVAASVARARAAGGRRPAVFASWIGQSGGQAAQELFAAQGVPHYPTPESAVSAIGHLLRYQRNQALLLETPAARPHVPHDRTAARAIVGAAVAEGREWLSEREAKAVLKAYGVAVVETEEARTPREAAAIAARMGFPAAIKILSPDITHKTDCGGVALNLRDAQSVLEAAEAMLARVASAQPNARILGFTVQPMAQRPGAHELICGIMDDPVFGPAILFGQGGTAVEVAKDTHIALPPLNAPLCADLIGRTRIARLLAGYRGRPAAKMEAVTDALLALQDIAADLPEVAELDINPLWADQAGAIALDARVRLAPPRALGAGRFAIRPYPTELEGTLSDAAQRVYRIRPIRPEDAGAIQRLVQSNDPEDIRLRFFTALRSLPEDLVKRLTQIDYDREMAFVAFEADSGAEAGIVRLSCDPDFDRGEFAIIVRSAMKGRGLGRRLMTLVTDYARSRGVRHVFGDVLAENHAMLGLARSLGFHERFLPGQPGIVEVSTQLE